MATYFIDSIPRINVYKGQHVQTTIISTPISKYANSYALKTTMSPNPLKHVHSNVQLILLLSHPICHVYNPVLKKCGLIKIYTVNLENLNHQIYRT